ncbi:MAG: BamA/TamA family outer membrane protein [Gammaproteobacteria bacterium]
MPLALEVGSEDQAAYRLEERLFTGTGIDLRYSTPIGPLRADIGVPLDRRLGVDDIIQIYVIIGQAF